MLCAALDRGEMARYNAIGPQALRDLHRNNGAPPSVLRPELLAKLKVRLKEPPPDSGLWTSGKVAQVGFFENWICGIVDFRNPDVY